MPVVVCPACQRKARVPDSAIGKNVKCPSCAVSFPAVAVDTPVTPGRATSTAEEVPEPSPIPAAELSPEDEARRTTRTGVGILAASQALFAIAMALQLVVTLLRLITAESTSKNEFLASFGDFIELVSMLSLLIGSVASLAGAVFCALPPGPTGTRAIAASIALLSLLATGQMAAGRPRELVSAISEFGRAGAGTSFGGGLSGVVLLVFLTAAVYEAARQALLSLYARSQARRLGDRMIAGLSGLLAIAFPVAVIGLNVIVLVVATFVSKPQVTFNKVIMVLELLARTALVALGAFVLFRVWARLGKTTERAV